MVGSGPTPHTRYLAVLQQAGEAERCSPSIPRGAPVLMLVDENRFAQPPKPFAAVLYLHPADVSACASSPQRRRPAPEFPRKTITNDPGICRQRALTCHSADGRGSSPSRCAAHFYLSSPRYQSKARGTFEGVWKLRNGEFLNSWYKCGKMADVRFCHFWAFLTWNPF